jgi:hypothetical protein
MAGIRWLISVVMGIAASQPAAPSTQPAAPLTQPSAALIRPAPTTQPAAARPDTRPAAAIVSLGDPKELLAHLCDPDWHVRRKAQDTLVRGGTDAKPFIFSLIEKATDDEARKNAQAALGEIDENRLIGPSYLTLHFKNAPAAEVFDEISRQCYAPLLTVPDNLFQQEAFAKVTVDADRQPFWAVVPRICKQLGVDFRHYQGGMRLMRSGGMQVDGISRVQGAFLIVATQISYTRTRAFAGHGEQNQFGMQISVYPEPKLNVLRGSGSVQVDQAIDDRGNSLLPQGAGARGAWGGFMGYGGWGLFAPLHYPKNIGSHITHFKAGTAFVIQVESQKIEMRELASFRPITRTIYNMPITLQEFKKTGDTWQLHLHISQPNFGSPDWPQLMEGVQNRLHILDADGNLLDHRGMSTNSNNSSMDMTLDFARSNGPNGQLSGEPARLAWEVPTKTRQLTVPIEFNDLPLFDDK